MTKEENEALKIKWNKLENDIIEEVSKLDNDKLMDMFLDWMNIRNQLNEDWLKFWDELMEKVQAKNLQQPPVIKSLRATKIKVWCKEIIDGAGGFISYEEHELIIWHISRERAVAEWVIRCLANPENEGSQMVIDSIIKRRKAIARNVC